MFLGSLYGEQDQTSPWSGCIVLTSMIRSSLKCTCIYAVGLGVISKHHFQDKILACLGLSILHCSCFNWKTISLSDIYRDWPDIWHDFVMANYDLSCWLGIMHDYFIRSNSMICNAWRSGWLNHPFSQAPRLYKTWVQSQTQNKAQWLAACGQVSASSQSLRFIFNLENELKFYYIEARA